MRTVGITCFIVSTVALGNKYLKKRCLELKKTEYEFKCPKCGHTWTKVVENEEYKTLNKILVEYNPLKKETIDNAKETVEKVFSKMKTSFANPLKEKIKLFKKEQKNKIKPIHHK